MFSMRLPQPNFPFKLSRIALGVSISLLLSACGGGGGGGSSSTALSITGSVNTSDYPISQSADGWSRLAHWLGFKSVNALSINEVDSVVAIPTDHGNVDVGVYDHFKSAKLAADGSFDLSLTKEYDWVLLLVNSKALTPEQKVVAYVTIPASVSVAEDGSLVDLPFSAATSDAIDIGKFSTDPNDPQAARSDRDAPSIVADVSLSLDDLKKYAKYDDAYRHLANVYLNYNDNGDFYFPIVEWRWQGIDPTLIGTEPTQPEEFTLLESDALIETNTHSIQFSDLCESKVELGLFPPKEVIIDQQAFSSANGMMNTDMQTDSSGNGQCGNDLLHIQQPDGSFSTLSFGFPIVDAEGLWKLKANDKQIAQFKFTLGKPVDNDGYFLAFVPSLKINYDATQNDQIDSIEIQWLQYDGTGGYSEIKDDAITDQLVSFSGINLIDYTEPAEGQDISFLHNDQSGLLSGKITIGGNYHWHIGNTTTSDPSHGIAHATEIAVGYIQGGVSYRFSWRDDRAK